ncbi:hypothetical protein, partial [Streptomyces sp. NPDC056296]|uniref:hypothetical protein n=1 Tax=Streptomyces sp. NPDC056296 TaxID=3345775 RepID=UPI0035D54215
MSRVARADVAAPPVGKQAGASKQGYLDLLAHLDDPEGTPPPDGYQAPFYKADREAEMRAAHAHFQARLDAEIAAGRWSSSRQWGGGQRRGGRGIGGSFFSPVFFGTKKKKTS